MFFVWILSDIGFTGEKQGIINNVSTFMSSKIDPCSSAPPSIPNSKSSVLSVSDVGKSMS